MSIFEKATQSDWYSAFLNPVVEAICEHTKSGYVLDVGTGLGTLPQKLLQTNSDLHIIGVDIDASKIEIAQKNITHKHTSFYVIQSDERILQSDSKFDVVAFCSVLFLVDDPTKMKLIKAALNLLKPSGKIIILTPSGSGSLISIFREAKRYRGSWSRFSFLVWKIVTAKSASKWKNEQWLEKFALDNRLNHTSKSTFNNNALVDVISNRTNP